MSKTDIPEITRNLNENAWALIVDEDGGIHLLMPDVAGESILPEHGVTLAKCAIDLKKINERDK